MFKQRLVTTLILVPAVLAAIYYSNFWVFAAAVFVLVMACGLEWLPLIPVVHLPVRLFILAGLLVCALLIHLVIGYWLIAGLALWFLLIFAVLLFPASQRVWGNRPVVTGLCFALLPLFGQSLLSIYELEGGKELIFYLLFFVWAADIGAYLAGKQWGKHKLIPVVSPGKTLEGLAGGAVLASVVAVSGYWYFQPHAPLMWVLINVLVFFIALLGDLFISILKRRQHVKDTGHLIPGHGGVLDRLDSLIAAAPAFYFGLEYLVSGTLKWLIH
ncbi:phosphatidate cytidylyltransferase [Legionella taurinensis]|uniref:Phosphatidate cytidylyltransferase n=1 Tax=Legionella taurinensis TaxID=70611 RepID=A0A3A5L775_9GAMM|nr:phosphatidate cytidylyltransferase [Legionella taurinensis]MDX1837717.1 phosphatidate cytidylyltransferase [Legionella taurinensis]PUT39999.1 phosphatidate cytidylyltransferase [Legionella taurinensis]PUT43765.1 phosphatidate cytidylyltransferase [Legionella taurinensis]PUT46102.1 phosphatidate cytidylyltransferase [Legionella taurinensis]PUT47920.1 phosphatidate cytidylyltransferase [Legionella taurinensis]